MTSKKINREQETINREQETINREQEEKENKNIFLFNQIFEDSKLKAKTNILDHIKFVNVQDEQVFKRLPLSDKQKEQLLFQIYLPPEEIKVLHAFSL